MLKYTSEEIKQGLLTVLEVEAEEYEVIDKRYKFGYRDLAQMIEHSYTGLTPSYNTIANWIKDGRVHENYHYSLNELLDRVFIEGGKYYSAYIDRR